MKPDPTPDTTPDSRPASRPDPIRPTSDEARALARGLLAQMRHAALGTIEPETGIPLVTRIAVQADPDGAPVALLSALAAHSAALAQDQRAGLLVATEAVSPAEPMARARLSILARARPAPPDPGRRDRWLARDPGARAYLDLPDFRFWRLEPVSGLLNAGFGRAFRLAPDDMLKPPAA